MDYRVLLSHFPKITYRRYERLAAHFPDLTQLATAEFDDIQKAGIEPDIVHEFLLWRETHSPAQIEERLIAEQIHTVHPNDTHFPPLLKEIADPPLTLFVRGEPSALTRSNCVAVVGTRRASNYGLQITTELTSELAARGVVIVSGLALGIDGVAHEAAINAQGCTIAVLGSGINKTQITPPSHRGLSERIIAVGGAIVSEYPPDFAPTNYSFPARNRIIAGMSLGVLVTEAPGESGALITARAALDYNREVFAIPHPITSSSGEGCNRLIQQGAMLVTKSSDIIEALNLHHLEQITAPTLPQPGTPLETKLFSGLSRTPLHIDEIIRLTGLPSATVASTLMLLELKGLVRNSGAGTYTRAI